MNNQVVVRMVKDLKRASAKNNAPIWAKLAKLALKPNSVRRTINLKRIDELTKENDVVFFSGKVLGTGKISHKITLCSFAISNSAASRIKDSGGQLVGVLDMIEKYPSGKGVNLLG
ncbi:MAG: 50S ribosomal protein L18e [Thaumarchaeota archaeon]|nr:50S ribosomal protein L18e [Nitrososphaerota archaeon]